VCAVTRDPVQVCRLRRLAIPTNQGMVASGPCMTSGLGRAAHLVQSVVWHAIVYNRARKPAACLDHVKDVGPKRKDVTVGARNCSPRLLDLCQCCDNRPGFVLHRDVAGCVEHHRRRAEVVALIVPVVPSCVYAHEFVHRQRERLTQPKVDSHDAFVVSAIFHRARHTGSHLAREWVAE
jgi:hypothetical protein